MKVRTRFAPSPTGYLHVGGLRTALFAYLYARKNGGEFILRIEDTDRERFVPDAEAAILTGLKWAGIVPDNATYFISMSEYSEDAHGPYVQSRRLEIYKKYAYQLIDSGHAYFAFDTAEELAAMREAQEAAKQAPRYDRMGMRNQLTLGEDEAGKLLKSGAAHVIRFKVPEDQVVTFQDVIHGEISIQTKEIDDQILIKSDGYPTYPMAVVIDDHLMEISHIIRGDEFLSSTPKHVLLYQALGWELPQFVHLPPVLSKETRKKLSKREGDVALDDFRTKGYLPEGLINFLALLGWNPGDEREFFTLDELAKEFSLDRVHKSPAVFDLDKLNHINAHYVRQLSFDEFVARAKSQGIALPDFDEATLARVHEVAQSRLVTLADLSGPEYAFVSQLGKYDPALLVFAKSSPADTKKGLTKAIELLENSEVAIWDSIESLSSVLTQAVADTGLKNGDVFWPVRVALSGADKSPSPAELLWILGRDESLDRLAAAQRFLNS